MNGSSARFREQLPFLDATSMARALRCGKYSCHALMLAHLELIKERNPALNAVVTVAADAALSQARAADLALARGDAPGELHGVPFTVKDAIMTGGIRTTVGDRQMEHHVPERDAAAVSRLKRAGAILIGKTNCPRMCLDVQTDNELFGRTRNPFDVERTCGGSSGGEAAAVAAGLSPLGLGSDTAGSVRIPASYCGVYGLKPSQGALSRDGLAPPYPGAVNLDHHLSTLGPLARSVRDLALCYRVLAAEPEAAEQQKGGGTIAYSAAVPGLPLDDSVRGAVARTASILGAAGFSLTKTGAPIDLPAALGTARELLQFEFLPRPKNDFSGKLFWKTLFSGGTFRYYQSLHETRLLLQGALDRFLSDYDCWLLPATPSAAPPHNPTQLPVYLVQGGVRREVSHFAAALSFTFPFNLTGHPALVLPVGRDLNGLPLAVQLVGRRGGDRQLLRIAGELDGALRAGGGWYPISIREDL